MPYGVSKGVGGDNPTNDSLMERCVADLTAKGTDKVSAIRICKASIQRSLAKKQQAMRQ